MRKEVERQIISKPAAMFTLKDLDGNTVSLADYKGKTVILDFWATWCGPCKRSFPAMKLAVNKYKDDPTVKFLFIHTWEKEENATSNAKKYIDGQEFPFKVLMDLKDPETGLNKVVESYKVNAIPAKFVIDKYGNIRFELSGFSGGDDAAVEEITAMIELANNTK
jgi:thiol-disulfide isomerase/thioredoxin